MEQIFTLTSDDMQIPCRLSEPDYGQIRRVVIGVHGLGGSATDDIQQSIAEEMEMFYAATLRFDFPAHGENTCEELSLRRCRETLLTVARYARERFPEVEDLCIFATGFGAYVTMLCLENLLELPGKVKLVVQTPCVRMHDTILAMKKISRPTLEAMGSVIFRTPRPFLLTYEFYRELAEHIALVTYPIPFLILHGEEDAYIRMEDIQNLHRINEQSQMAIIPGTTHQFLEEGAWDMVLDLTRDWFEFEQVLLM